MARSGWREEGRGATGQLRGQDRRGQVAPPFTWYPFDRDGKRRRRFGRVATPNPSPPVLGGTEKIVGAGFGTDPPGHQIDMIESVEFVTIQCPDCGPGLVPLAHVSLRVNQETDRASMAFPCAVCGIRTAIEISAHSVIVLRNAGIDPVYWRYPSELTERDHETAGRFPTESVEQLASELETDIEAFLRAG